MSDDCTSYGGGVSSLPATLTSTLTFFSPSHEPSVHLYCCLGTTTRLQHLSHRLCGWCPYPGFMYVYILGLELGQRILYL